jgi:hypothetical protein
VLWQVLSPQGLQISGGPAGDATFTWTPPEDAGPVEVHVRATDPDNPGLTAEQKFRLIVTDE